MSETRHDRDLLLHGAKRSEVLTLEDVQQYGIDSFADPDYLRIYGMTPAEWYTRGIRLLGRTAVECTRDALADRIGRDIATVMERLQLSRFSVIDPFAGSCNTLYWILRHLPNAEGLAFEVDPLVFKLSKSNIALLDRRIEFTFGDYQTQLSRRRFPPHHALIVFVAPPWGTALDESQGLDLRRTTPPVTDIIGRFARDYKTHKILFATQVYEKVEPNSRRAVEELLQWSQLRVYDLNEAGSNHGVLLGTYGWTP
jgi:hypothetical protein